VYTELTWLGYAVVGLIDVLWLAAMARRARR
jgi:hypothetical protein